MIEKKFLEQNSCFTSPTKIVPEFIIVHSTGVGYKSKDSLFNGWNKPDKLSVHGMVDNEGAYHTLPLNYLGWHVGKRATQRPLVLKSANPKALYISTRRTQKSTRQGTTLMIYRSIRISLTDTTMR